MFSLVQTVRYYQSRFIFLFAWRSFGVDFVSLILQHARHFLSLSLSREKCFRFCSREMMIWWEKKFEEERSKRETFATKSSSPKQRARLSLVPLSRALKPFKEERKRERDWCAFRKKREILIAGGGSKLPPKDQHHLARALVALSFSLSLSSSSPVSPPSSRRSRRILRVFFRARFSRTIHSPYY